MDTDRFDALARSLTAWISRRQILGGLPAALGLMVVKRPRLAEAGKRRKKLKRNEFGCVNVGDACRGKDKNCCSGICRGKKPKRGEKDKSRCVGHDAQGCQAGQIEQFCGGTDVVCTTSTGDTAGFCDTTTGNAGYCSGEGMCIPGGCSKDADCIPVFGKGAACVLCDFCDEGVGCAGLD